MSSRVRVHQAYSEEATAGSRVTLTKAAAHYVLHVHRLRTGDALVLFDGKGRSHPAVLVSENPDGPDVVLGEALETSGAQAGPRLVLVQALLKADKLEWVLQKGTELGVHAFELTAAHRCVARVEPSQSEKKLERWKKIAEEAARQCGRSDVPAIRLWDSWTSALQRLGGEPRFVLDEEEKTTRLQRAWRESDAQSAAQVALCVGPEGGWERSEIAQLTGTGGIAVSLGDRILRAETAAMAAATVAQHLAGALG